MAAQGRPRRTTRGSQAIFAVGVIAVMLLSSALAQDVKAFRALDFGDSVATVCAKITGDDAFTADSKEPCGSTATEFTLYGPPYGTVRPVGLTSLRPFYTVRVLGYPLSVNLDFVDDQLYDIGLRTWPNLRQALAARSLYQEYVAILDRAVGPSSAHNTSRDPSSTVVESYTWSAHDKTASVRLNYYGGNYWIEILINDQKLTSFANQRATNAVHKAAADKLRQQQDKARQQEQDLEHAAKDF